MAWGVKVSELFCACEVVEGIRGGGCCCEDARWGGDAIGVEWGSRRCDGEREERVEVS